MFIESVYKLCKSACSVAPAAVPMSRYVQPSCSAHHSVVTETEPGRPGRLANARVLMATDDAYL